jgi:pyruvate formate lyase activating enzyme
VETGTIFNIQRYSIDDGPGIRTTVFVKGCPLRCPWCSNPESQSPNPQILYRYTSCKKCGTCVQLCPNQAIALGESGITIDRAKCAVCGACAEGCLADALKISGEEVTVDKVWKTVRKDEVYYETSGGGVTCSGGEILTQPDFVVALFKKCKENGVHTCADTSGFGSEDAMRKILEFSDLVYFDMKHSDPAKHKEFTGVELDTVLRNLKLCTESGVDITIRIPLIPEYNNSADTLEAVAELIRSLAPAASVSILPYHKYGASKYSGVGMSYTLDELRENTPEELEQARAIFELHGFDCKVS